MSWLFIFSVILMTFLIWLLKNFDKRMLILSAVMIGGGGLLVDSLASLLVSVIFIVGAGLLLGGFYSKSGTDWNEKKEVNGASNRVSLLSHHPIFRPSNSSLSEGRNKEENISGRTHQTGKEQAVFARMDRIIDKEPNEVKMEEKSLEDYEDWLSPEEELFHYRTGEGKKVSGYEYRKGEQSPDFPTAIEPVNSIKEGSYEI